MLLLSVLAAALAAMPDGQRPFGKQQLFALLLLLALTSGAGADDGLWDGVVEAPSTTTPSGKPGQVAPTPAPSSSPTYPPDTDVATAVFDMKGVQGTIVFEPSSNGHTQITVTLWGLQGLATSYHISQKLVDADNPWQPCSYRVLGGTYNVSDGRVVEATKACKTPSTDCAQGDLSGKHGLLPPKYLNMTFEDVSIPLGGPNGIVGRAVVIYRAGNYPWVCALIQPGRLLPNKPHAAGDEEIADEDIDMPSSDDPVPPRSDNGGKVWALVIVICGFVVCIIALTLWCILQTKHRNARSLRYEPGPIEMRMAAARSDDL